MKNQKYTRLLIILILLAGCAGTPKPAVQKADSSVATNSQANAKARVLYRQGKDALAAGKTPAALVAFDEAIKINPALALPYYGKGLAALQLKRFPEASAAFAKAIALKPDFYQAYHGLGVAQRNMGDFRDAERSYLAAIRYASVKEPTYADPYLNLGILYEVYLDDKPRALKYYREYVKLSDNESEKVKTWIGLLEK